MSRVDPTVDFVWGAGSPAPGIAADTFSARWTGEVVPQFSQTYTFSTLSIGGVRVTVNGKKIIDNWTSHSTAVTNSGTIALTAGKYYPIQVDYREDGKATMKLSWSSASQPKPRAIAGRSCVVMSVPRLGIPDSSMASRISP